MTDQEKLDEVTARLTGFTPIHVVRGWVVPWMRNNMSIAMIVALNNASLDRVIFRKPRKGDIWEISIKDWRTLFDEAKR